MTKDMTPVLARMEGAGFGAYISCDAGWQDLILLIDTHLAMLDPNYVLLQCKEKFGGLRYYADTQLEGEKRKLFEEVVRHFENRSLTICEVCGNDKAETRNINRWLKTLCGECATER